MFNMILGRLIVKFNVLLEQHSGLLLTVWDSSLTMIRTHFITILIHYDGGGSPALVPPKVQFEWEHGGHCIHDVFFIHQVPFARMAVFCRRASNPGLTVRSWMLYQQGNCSFKRYWEIRDWIGKTESWFFVCLWNNVEQSAKFPTLKTLFKLVFFRLNSNFNLQI